MRTADGVTDIRLLESAPATLAGRPGFRVVTAFRSESGLPRGIAMYGLLDGNGFYARSYLAPERVYLERGRGGPGSMRPAPASGRSAVAVAVVDFARRDRHPPMR